VKEYDIFIPLKYNDGSPVEPVKIEALKRRLLERFEGVTYFPQPNEGYWKAGGVTYRDEIVIFRVLSPKRRAARRFLSRLKEDLQEELRQEVILIVERDVEAL
jgi:hypothetical protein